MVYILHPARLGGQHLPHLGFNRVDQFVQFGASEAVLIRLGQLLESGSGIKGLRDIMMLHNMSTGGTKALKSSIRINRHIHKNELMLKTFEG